MENPFPAETHNTAPTAPESAVEPQPISEHAGEPHAPSMEPTASSGEDAHPHAEEGHDTVQPPSENHDEPELADRSRTLEGKGEAHPKKHEEHSSEDSVDKESESPEPVHGSAEKPEEASEHEKGSLEYFAARARRGRLHSDEEAEAVPVLKDALLGGRSDVARAVAATPSLPWVVSVQATASAWPEMKASFKAQFLAGLARTEGEQAARVRLSLARGLFKVDQAASLKLILLTLKLLRNKETGLLEGKGPALFSNVLIGRGKAWALQLPLEEVKPAEADLLVFAALHGAFHAPQAPVAQLSILRWAATGDRLMRLPEALSILILKGVSRWSAKWQSALRKEVAPIPEAWSESLKPSPAKHTHAKTQPDEQDSTSEKHGPESDVDDDTASEEALRDAQEGRFRGPSTEHSGDDDESDEPSEAENADAEDDDGEPDSKPRSQKQRPVYVSKTVPTSGNMPAAGPHSGRRGPHQQSFNLQDTLRQIDNYVAGLRGELQVAQKQLRQRDEDPRRNRKPERTVPVLIPGELSAEELLRLNQQLETRNAELKARIEELTLDSEERAASSGLTSDTPVSDPSIQLRSLLGFKLKDDYEDFLALQQESRDLVVQQHYRTVLQHVFEVLLTEGIQFPASEVTPVS